MQIIIKQKGTNLIKDLLKQEKKMSKELQVGVDSFLNDTIKEMQAVIKPWSYRKTKGLGVINSFVVQKNNKKDSFLRQLSNIAPHANMLEDGVKSHVTTFKRHPELKRWAQKRGLQLKNTNKLTIGGPGSFIQKGHSDRKFFYDTFDKQINQGKLDKKILKQIDIITK